MIELCAIASGSNGNCYYVGNEDEAVLIDAGISARRIISRMQQNKLDPDKVKAVFISHEHRDHTNGARVFSKRMKVPVYVTAKTFGTMYSIHKPASPRFFVPGTRIEAGSFCVYPFLKNHDAVEPCSFRVEYNGYNVGVITDLGSPSDQVTHHLNQCHAVFLETNYDQEMLRNGSYPWPLKKRIASDRGHLSNDQAFDLLTNHSGNQLQLVFLSHLSAENNTPETAMNRFSEMNGKLDIQLTSRYAPGEVIRLRYGNLNE